MKPEFDSWQSSRNQVNKSVRDPSLIFIVLTSDGTTGDALVGAHMTSEGAVAVAYKRAEEVYGEGKVKQVDNYCGKHGHTIFISSEEMQMDWSMVQVVPTELKP